MSTVLFRTRKTHSALLAAGLSLGLVCAASAAPKQENTQKTQHFMTEAIQGDLAEVNMGQLAQQKGQSDQVKQFGKTLEQDHSDHLQKAKQIAGQNNLNVPSAPNEKQTAVYDKMKNEPDAKFDRAFARAMVKDHEKDIKMYEKEAKSKSPLADFAQQTVPTLQKHLQMAKSLTSGKERGSEAK